MNKIYLLEERAMTSKGDMECNVAGVFSSEEKAISFLKESSNERDKSREWWWALTEEYLDDPIGIIKYGAGLRTFDWNGQELTDKEIYQPVDGYKEMEWVNKGCAECVCAVCSARKPPYCETCKCIYERSDNQKCKVNK